MESKKLEALLMAVDLGSFTKAAEVLGYTQSGLTHMMNSLEKEVGFTLLERGRSGVRLTEEGERVAPAVREFLQANARLDSVIEQVACLAHGDHPRQRPTPASPCTGCRASSSRFREECPDVRRGHPHGRPRRRPLRRCSRQGKTGRRSSSPPPGPRASTSGCYLCRRSHVCRSRRRISTRRA